jgi:hypothetical protein
MSEFHGSPWRNGCNHHTANWLIDYSLLYVPRKNFSLIGRRQITGEGLQNLGLCSALRAFEQGGIFIVPHLLWHGDSVFHSHPNDHPIQSPLTTHKGILRIDSYPDPHRSRTADGKGSAKWSERDRCCMWGHRRLRTPYALIWAAVLQWKVFTFTPSWI